MFSTLDSSTHVPAFAAGCPGWGFKHTAELGTLPVAGVSTGRGKGGRMQP